MTADPVVSNVCAVIESSYLLLGLRLFLQHSCSYEDSVELGVIP